MRTLPEEFKERMRRMLLEEYPAFEESFCKKSFHALRINQKKAGEEFLKRTPFSLSCVPWADGGYYYGEEDFPGKHPYHEAGVYYIQEPSAMAPAEYLEAKPGERILDLCAAPGGKSTQIADKMQGKGVLVCNEIHPARAKILSENIERMGICNAIVTNETPKRLMEAFPEYFDRILVDAPCSGEGMFRKNEAAGEEWSLENVALCAARQDEILGYAARMLRPGGRLLYSTCTFAPEEDEGSVSRFLARFPEFQICKVKKEDGMTGGYRKVVLDAAEQIEDTIRLFPHKLGGEGHYLAVLQKEGKPYRFSKYREERGILKKDLKEWLRFSHENLKKELDGTFLNFGEQLYLSPGEAPSFRGLKTLRPGLHLGTNKKNRFEPSHALALALEPDEVFRSVDFPSDGSQIRQYLEGQTLMAGNEKGWYLITTDGYSIGWGKCSDGRMKNHYPKGLRKKLQ